MEQRVGTLGVCSLAVCLAAMLAVGCNTSTGSSPSAARDATANDATASDATANDEAADSMSSAIPSDGPDCRPGDVSAFAPPPYLPEHARSLACVGQGGDGGVLQGYVGACVGGAATYATCVAFLGPSDASGSQDCYDCLFPSSDGGVGAAVARVSNVAVVNYAGCIELVDPTATGAACARSISAAVACTAYACRACPVNDIASRDQFLTCTSEALTGACAGYGLQAAACVASERGDGGTAVASVCFPGPNIEHNYLSFAQYLCGGP